MGDIRDGSLDGDLLPRAPQVCPGLSLIRRDLGRQVSPVGACASKHLGWLRDDRTTEVLSDFGEP